MKDYKPYQKVDFGQIEIFQKLFNIYLITSEYIKQGKCQDIQSGLYTKPGVPGYYICQITYTNKDKLILIHPHKNNTFRVVVHFDTQGEVRGKEISFETDSIEYILLILKNEIKKEARL